MTASKSKHSQMEESKISFITKTSDGTSSMCTSIFNTGRVTAVTAGCTSASCLGGQRWPAASGGPFCFYGRWSFPAAPPLKREENSKLEKLEQHFHRILYISAVSSVRGQKKSLFVHGENVTWRRAAAWSCWEPQKRRRASWRMLIGTHYHCGWLYNQLCDANECLSSQQACVLSHSRCTARASSLEVSGGRAEKALSGALAPVKRPPSLLFLLLGQRQR